MTLSSHHSVMLTDVFICPIEFEKMAIYSCIVTL